MMNVIKTNMISKDKRVIPHRKSNPDGGRKIPRLKFTGVEFYQQRGFSNAAVS